MARELKQLYSADWQTMLLLADAELASKNFKEAREILSRLTVLSPNNSDLLLKLAHAENELGDLDAAMKNARKSTQAGAQDPRTHIALGDYLKDNRDEKAALLQYERALDLRPQRAFKKRAMLSILSIYVGQNRLEEAYELSGQWADKNQDEAFCHFNHAWIASQLEGTEYRDTAIEEYKTAIKLDKSLASARYNLALLLLKGGQNKEALSQLQAFVKDSPEDKDAAHARELLGKLTAAPKAEEESKP
ncbi:MAG TPA: tetratricopeptide repeat protein [Candidatus Melainabacteria bacterium]|nr:tetratricopeptide repeat protein [Candidatus Melainabacteria bacterium]